ncbi:DEAD/DEAH box helicase [Spirosoma luteum]|uniref:DEAD/DEAH box helicase n=1 Tax=Spirosoma luteum TaxID=431553 RepID=UPI0003A4A5C0|nr:DEAD/DEAH box helicase [Spirosoma luteum]
MIHLRPYQEDARNGIRGHFVLNNRKVLLCMPTGSGKTVTFADLVTRTLSKDLFAKALILTNRAELLTQAGGTLERMGIRYEAITATNKQINLRARCFVGMVETYYKRAKKHPELLKMNLVIIDEAHYGNFKKLFAQWGSDVYVIGATATPLSASKDDPLSNYYNAIVNPVQIADLIDNGYLVPAVTYAARIDRSSLKLDSMGEYSDSSQMDTFAKREVYAGLISKYLQFCTDEGRAKKTIIFNVNIAHSKAVCAEFEAAGIPARHLDGETDPWVRASIIAGFKSGAFPVICNVGILNAGFDEPGVEVIVMNRATTSVSLWLQCCGRGSRPSPGKGRFTILDMGDNWQELGLWEQARPWEELWNKKRKKSEKAGVSPVKDCAQCGAIVPMSARECSECGHVFPIKEKGPSKEVEFTVVADTRELLAMDKATNWPIMSVSDLERVREAKNRSKGWPIHVIRDRAISETDFREQLKELAHLRGYKRGWEKYVDFAKPQPELA